MSDPQCLESPRWPLPQGDDWSTPFAESLLHHLELYPGLSILDIACGDGIPAFHVAEQVGPTGRVLAMDCNDRVLARARTIQGSDLPWLRFVQGDMRALSDDLPAFDRVIGNLSVMFFRPDRPATLRQLVKHVNPGGQLVLTFPSLGTFDSLWARIDQEMARRGLRVERRRLEAYVAERPSAGEGRSWLDKLGLVQIQVTEWPLEVATGSGELFLHHPLLRGGFLDDAYECFDDQELANEVMTTVSTDLASFLPLIAQRCALSGYRPR